jgi:hypothetical protein
MRRLKRPTPLHFLSHVVTPSFPKRPPTLRLSRERRQQKRKEQYGLRGASPECQNRRTKPTHKTDAQKTAAAGGKASGGEECRTTGKKVDEGSVRENASPEQEEI